MYEERRAIEAVSASEVPRRDGVHATKPENSFIELMCLAVDLCDVSSRSIKMGTSLPVGCVRRSARIETRVW